MRVLRSSKFCEDFNDLFRISKIALRFPRYFDICEIFRKNFCGSVQDFWIELPLLLCCSSGVDWACTNPIHLKFFEFI